MTRSIAGFLIASLMPLALMAQSSGTGDEQSRIAEERRAVESAFTAQEKACYRRFAVNDCLQDARSQRREALAELRRREVALNDAERRRKGAERLQDLEERAAERGRSGDGQGPDSAPPSPVGGGSAPATPATRRAGATSGVPSAGPAAAAAAPAGAAPAAPAPAAATVPAPARSAVREPGPAAANPSPSPADLGARARESSMPDRKPVANPPKPRTRAEPAVSTERRQRQQKRLEEAQARKERAAQKAAGRTERAKPLPVP